MYCKYLYLTEDYPYSKVHHELCRHIGLQDERIHILLYSVIRSGIKDRDLRPQYEGINYETLFYNLESKSELRYKYDFYYKIKTKYDWLLQHTDITAISKVHAATLFSEGAVALKLYKEKGIPYIVAVRGTDIMFYFRYMFYLWNLGLEILKNAEKVIFITDTSYRSLCSLKYLATIKNELEQKKIILPNGVDHYWIENAFSSKRRRCGSRLLYIGVFDKNKNVISLLKAVLKLKESNSDIHLTLIGGGGVYHEKVLSYCQKYPDLFEYRGKILDKTVLAKQFREHDIFTMVSHSETFGLVYIEALSQGLPILYTKGQGIDGVLAEKVGEGVDSHNLQDIIQGIEKIKTDYFSYSCIGDDLYRFSWPSIACSYIDMYLNKY